MKSTTTTLELTRTAAVAVRRGHPWVWREGIARTPRDLASGAAVDLDADGEHVACGLWDASSPIAVRVFGAARATTIGERSLIDRIERALSLRDRLFPECAETDAYRLCNGEGDGLPGLVIDRYAHVAIARLDGEHLAPWIERLAPALGKRLSERGIRSVGLRIDPSAGRKGATTKVRPLTGDEPPERVLVRERGMKMDVDLWHGQKTGAFLDQRDNRALVRRLAARAPRVLNLYSYAGGFSVAAALGGAERVTSVDTAAAAHATAQRTFRANDLDPTRHAFVTADVFDFLERAHQRGERFDLVVSDPPSFAPSEKALARALVAYRKLHTAAARLVSDTGVICAASCSSHVTLDDFLGTLDRGAVGDARVLEVHGQPADHPTIPAWREGRYLKMVVLG